MASDSENTNTTFEAVVSSIKTFESAELAAFMKHLVSSLDASELFKLLKAVAAEAEKKSKTASRTGKAAPKATVAKKTGSMPKGAIPPQLKKPRAWVEFTLKDALENGWEPFTVIQKKKDKETNTVTEEQIEMPGSTLHNGAHIYKGSVTEKTPEGKQLIHKEAMSLSKQRKEASHSSYSRFTDTYVDESSDDDKSVTSSTSSKKIVVKKTAAEKEAEAVAKKEAKETEKAAAKAAKEADKEAKKAEKEAEKAAAKAEKDSKKTSVKAPVPVAAVKKVVAKPVEAEKPVTAPKKKPAAAKEDIPDDGMVHPWTYNKKKYLRNADGETWTVGADGGVGSWAGMYDAKSDKFDTSAPEPVFEDSD
jgi:hypothetical protein